MLKDTVIDQMSKFERRRYLQLTQDYWDAVEKLAEKRQDPSFDTGNLTATDLKCIENSCFTGLQKYEAMMRSVYI